MSGLMLPGDARIGVKPVRYRSLILGTPGLVSAWPLDEAAGASVADDAFAANNGTPTDVTFGSTSLVSPHTSADFNNSTSIVTVADHASLDLTTAMTAEAWINWDGGAAFDAAVSKWTAASSFLFGIDGATDVLTFYMNTIVSGIVAAVGATALSTGTTYHVVGTYDGTNHRVYLNGVQDGTRATSGTITTNNAALCIGDSPTDDHQFDGKIAWAALYDRALTAAEIQMRYVAGLRKRKLGLAA